MLRRLMILLLAIGTGMALTNFAAADPVFPPGLRIGLEPPAGMSLSPRFPGFEDPDHKAAINILDLPALAYDQLEKAAFADIQKGIDLDKREMFAFRSGIGFLITGTSQVDGATLHKYFLLASAIGGPINDLAMLINVEVPEAARSIYSDEVIRKALSTVTFRRPPLAEALGRLPFGLGDLAGFRVMEVMGTTGAIITDGPSNDITQQPYMVISVGRGTPAEADRARFARDLLSSAPVLDLTLVSGEAMRINGSSGFEIRAQGKDPHGNAIMLVQWLRFGGGGYVRIIGVTHKDQWDKMFNRFRAVRDGTQNALNRGAPVFQPRSANQNLMTLRMPAMKALPAVLAGSSGSATLPPGRTMYCRSGCTVHQGAICAA